VGSNSLFENICHLVSCALCILVSDFRVMQRSFLKCVLVTPKSYFGSSEENKSFNFPFLQAVNLSSRIVRLFAKLFFYVALFTLVTFYETFGEFFPSCVVCKSVANE
jgi:hypothetical protein